MTQDIKVNEPGLLSAVKKINLKKLKAPTNTPKKVNIPKKRSQNTKCDKIAKEGHKTRQGPFNKFLKDNIFKCTRIKTEKGKTFLTLQSLMCTGETGRTKLSVIVNKPKDAKKKKSEAKDADKYILPLSEAHKTNEVQKFSAAHKEIKVIKKINSKDQKPKKTTMLTNKTKHKALRKTEKA